MQRNFLLTQQKNIAILGSTGSIGKSSLEVIEQFPEQFKVTYLTTNTNIDELCKQVQKFKPKGIVVSNKESFTKCKNIFDKKLEILEGEHGLAEIVQREDVDIVISSLVGFAGLVPTIQAIKAKKKIALANKETLVVAGELMMNLAQQHNVSLLPVDSEHSAIFQCLVGEKNNDIHKIILTASGGPFRTKTHEELQHVTVEQALKHPNWNMGKKITIDSATLMNKGLEVIEAHWLFNLPSKKIEVLIHPQSIIHSMVEFVDGSIKAQLGVPDMKIPIQYALTYPERMQTNFPRISFTELQTMTFFEPDTKKFPCLRLAFESLTAGKTTTTVLNAANEIAVERFLQKEITFTQIPQLIYSVLEKHQPLSPTLENIIETDMWARTIAKEFSPETLHSYSTSL